jgi:glucokinase
MLQSPVLLGLDFGGTKIAVAVCGLDGTRLGSVTVGSDADLGARASFGRGVEAARDLLDRTAPGASLAAVGVSTFGIPFEDRVDLAPAIPGWGDLPFGRELRAAFPGAAIRMATDAKAAAQAEARWGALAGFDPAVYLNLGTGLSAALVIGGQVVTGAHGAAGEIGYNLRGLADVGVPLGARVPLEDMISGQALARRAPQSMAAADVFGAADEPGLDLLVSEFVTELAFHVVNLAICVNPARIAVGGGLVQSWERLRPGLEQALKAGTPFPPELVTARFPADAPLIGAVALAADAAGAEFSLDGIPSQLTNAPHAEHARTDSARADGAIDGAPVIQPSHSLTERLQS